MRCWQIMQQGLKSLFLIMLILASCSAPDSDNPEEGCGGIEATVSCLNIVSIIPTNGSNVDAFAHDCSTGSEVLTDHTADVTFSNTRFPTATGTFDIRIIGYRVSYVLNDCPRSAGAIGCPPLPGFTVQSETILVTAESTVVRTLPLVPLRVKQAYVNAGGELGIAAPSYSAFYVFTAQTTRFNDTFTVEGNTEFTITDFDTCAQ
jgi:hypothetical protein